MMRTLFLSLISVLFFIPSPLFGQTPPLSDETTACLGCHRLYTPGIVEDWLKSRHAGVTPAEAIAKPALERRVSAERADEKLAAVAVGCYECHARNTEAHQDSFDHNGFRINVVVSPRDCAACHPVEETQFRGSKKANAWGNLAKNPLYNTLVSTIIGVKTITDKGTVSVLNPSDYTRQDTCFSCHGMPIEVRGMRDIETPIGVLKAPELSNWPNMGVGRINPDGSRGACTACHPRHSFSIEVARKPYTCAQCHLAPDVPGWDVYHESKHGAIFFSKHSGWDFNRVPWRPAVDFATPTCAACHNSLLARPNGEVIVQRSHDFGSRLWVRLFGLIYSHPQPKQGDTSIIKNKDSLPMPATFSGEPASKFLIDKAEQARRKDLMKSLCTSCHGTSWVNGHFEKLDSTIKETDQMTLAATTLMLEAWNLSIADKTNPFDEAIEQEWLKQWLFYANSARYASAMTGAPDYTTFKYGFWDMTNAIQKIKDHIETKKKLLKIK